MIPLNLKLANFTSYGETPQELDFNKFHLAAISGTNGAGKSSLLDAITWAIWGTSRAGDSADSLIRLGASEMFVEFSFSLDGHTFTIKRKRVKKGLGSTTLEFWSGSHNLTEGTLKATQQKIINTLHLTYETFTNSSFLRQGNADEFTTKGPTDRKRILADILGLDHYDLLEEKAKEKAKERATTLQLLEYQLLEIETELSQKEEREKSLDSARQEAKGVEQQLAALEGEIKELLEKEKAASSLVQSLQEKKSQISLVQKELLDLNLQIEIKEKAKQEFETIQNQRLEIETKVKELNKLEADKKLLEEKRSQLIKVKDELALLQKAILGLEERRSKAIAQVQIDIKKLQTENEKSLSEIEALNKHKDTCPTCKQPIAQKINQEIIQKNKEALAENNQKLLELNNKLHKCQTYIIKESVEAKQKEDLIKTLEIETKDWDSISQKIILLEKYNNLYLKLKEADMGVKTHSEAIVDLQKLIANKKVQIIESEQELKQLGNMESLLAETKLSLQGKEEIKKDLAVKAMELRGKVGAAQELVSRSTHLGELMDKKRQEKQNLTQEKQAFEELSLAFGKKGIQAMIIEAAIPEVEEEANKLLTALSEGRMRVHFETQRETKTKVQKGDGKKDFGLVETLDIIISDEMGERPYELYSGGETFRVNFALRLAISQLLTRRAGAKLQFLVLDEGFGTQDIQGRSKIIEVINAIKDDFEKIVVITHIDELKEEFPARIEVSKGPTGSVFTVIGS